MGILECSYVLLVNTGRISLCLLGVKRFRKSKISPYIYHVASLSQLDKFLENIAQSKD